MSNFGGGIELETLLSEPKTSERSPGFKQNGWNNSSFAATDRLTSRENQAIDSVKFIADHLQEEYEEKQVTGKSS